MGKITFTYSALNAEGLSVKGTVEALDKEDALQKLRLLEAEGLKNISIENAVVEKDPAPDFPSQTAQAPIPLTSKIAIAIAIICTILLAVGTLRIYFGKETGIKIVFKSGFSFDDTLVHVDRFSELPKFVLEKRHPEVKKQFEEMGIKIQEEKEAERLLRNISKKPAQETVEKEAEPLPT